MSQKDHWEGLRNFHEKKKTKAYEWALNPLFSVFLVGGFNRFEKYARQIGSFPQVGVKIKNIWVATT